MMCANKPDPLVAKETNLEKEKAEVGSDKENTMMKKEQRKTELWMVEKILRYSQGFAFLLLLCFSSNPTHLQFPLFYCYVLWLSCFATRYLLGHLLPTYYSRVLPCEILATTIVLCFNRYGIRSFKVVPSLVFVVPNLLYIIKTCVIPYLEHLKQELNKEMNNSISGSPTNPNSNKESLEKEGLKVDAQQQAEDVGVIYKSDVYGSYGNEISDDKDVVEATPTAIAAAKGDDHFVHIQVEDNHQIMVASQEEEDSIRSFSKDSIRSFSLDFNMDNEGYSDDDLLGIRSFSKDSMRSFSLDFNMDNEGYSDDDQLSWPEELVSALIAETAAAAANPTPISNEQHQTANLLNHQQQDDDDEDDNNYKRFEQTIEDFQKEKQKWEKERKHLVSELNDAKSSLQHHKDMFNEERCKWEEEKAQLILNVSSQEWLDVENQKWKEERNQLKAKLNSATSLLLIQKESFYKDRCKWEGEKAQAQRLGEERKELISMLNDAMSLLQKQREAFEIYRSKEKAKLMALNSNSRKKEEEENHKEDVYFFDKEHRAKWELEDKASSSSFSSDEEEEEEEEKRKWEEEKKDLILELNNAKTLLENHKDTVDSFNEDRCKWEEEKDKMKEGMQELTNQHEQNTANLIKGYEVESEKWKQEKEELLDKLQGAKESSKYYKRAMIEAENLRITSTDQYNDVVTRLERANADADYYHRLLHLYYDHYHNYQQAQNQTAFTALTQLQQQQPYSCPYYYNNASAYHQA